MKNRLRSLFWPALGLGGFFLLWAAASVAVNNALMLPSPLVVAHGFRDLVADGSLLRDLRASLHRVLVGYALAAGLAIPLALVLAYFEKLRRTFLPVITLLRPIPPIAWIPLAILWFGLGDKPSYFITAVASFFPIFINAFAGGISVETDHLNAARCLGAGRWSMIRRIYLPSSLPQVWTGLRIGLGQSWMAVVTAELIAAPSGLGFLIQMSRLNLETPHVLVGMLVIGVVGALMTTLLGLAERFVLPWRRTLTHG